MPYRHRYFCVKAYPFPSCLVAKINNKYQLSKNDNQKVIIIK